MELIKNIMKQHIQISLSEKALQKLDNECKKQVRNRSNMIEYIIQKYLNEH